MADLFNRKTKSFSTGIKEASPLFLASDSFVAADFLKERVLLENHQRIGRETAIIERQVADHDSRSIVVEASMLESRIPTVINALGVKGKDIILKDIIFEFFNKSLILDDYFIKDEEYSLRAVVESYIDKNGGYSFIEKAYSTSKSPILKAIMEACEAISGKVCTRKICECKDGTSNIMDIDFDLDDEEKDDLDFLKGNLDIDQISDLIKDKVLTVVEEEKVRQQKETELDDDLETQATTDGTSVAEAYNKYVLKGTFVGIEEASVFNSILRHSYKAVLESQTILHADLDPDDEDDQRINSDNKNAMHDEFNAYTMKQAAEGEFNIKDEATRTLGFEPSIHDEEQNIDMDLILAESITKYTLMEVAYTLKLEDFGGYDGLQKISRNLLN